MLTGFRRSCRSPLAVRPRPPPSPRTHRSERQVDWRHREHSSLSRNEVRAYGLFLGQKERTFVSRVTFILLLGDGWRNRCRLCSGSGTRWWSPSFTNGTRNFLSTWLTAAEPVASFGHGHHPCQELTALRGESIGGIESTLASPGTKLEHYLFLGQK
jgi:hypothetical protein